MTYEIYPAYGRSGYQAIAWLDGDEELPRGVAFATTPERCERLLRQRIAAGRYPDGNVVHVRPHI